MRTFFCSILILACFAVTAETAIFPTGRGTLTGTIQRVQYGDPLKEPYVELAEIEIVNGRGEKVFVIVTPDTLIRDRFNRTGLLLYLQPRQHVTVEYEQGKDGRVMARRIQVLDREPEKPGR